MKSVRTWVISAVIVVLIVGLKSSIEADAVDGMLVAAIAWYLFLASMIVGCAVAMWKVAGVLLKAVTNIAEADFDKKEK